MEGVDSRVLCLPSPPASQPVEIQHPRPGRENGLPRALEKDKTWAVLVKKEPVSHQTFIKSALEAANLAEKKKKGLAAITRTAGATCCHVTE